uniref:Cystatin domain-containing protein n=1 Tax=Cyprinodon variegatus TaxID=28743 RepID=A0A3Q2CQ93_CYPVA
MLLLINSGSYHGVSMPGSPSNISRNDAALQQVVLTAAADFNKRSNDAFLFKPSAISTAQRQVPLTSLVAMVMHSTTLSTRFYKAGLLKTLTFPFHREFPHPVSVAIVTSSQS